MGPSNRAAVVPGPLGDTITLADLNGDNNPDIIVPDLQANVVSYSLGNGDGTFGPVTSLFAGEAPIAVAVADMGSQITLPDGSTVLGPPDGIPDLIVAATGTTLIAASGPPQVIILPGLVDAQGNFAGFGSPEVLASSKSPQDIQTADLTGNGVADAVVVQQDGLQVIYGKPPTLVPNDTPQSARNLGTVVHVVEPALAIVTGHEDAYYKLTVPTESVPGAGNEVIDFSGGFQYLEGAGLGMEVLDASGQVLGSGERFRIDVAQGATLTLHVFGATAADGTRGAGAYTLDIDVLPQVVSVQAQSVLPGAAGHQHRADIPGRPPRSGRRPGPGQLHRALAQAGRHGQVTGTQVIPLSATSLPVVYDASANLNVASGLTYPTAVRQTVTLLFDQPLPPGTYEIVLAPAIQAAVYNADEAGLLAGDGSFAGHPVVTARNGIDRERRRPRRDEPGHPGRDARRSQFDCARHAVLDPVAGGPGCHARQPADPEGRRPDDHRCPRTARSWPVSPRRSRRGRRIYRSPTSYLIVWFDPVSLDLQSAQGQGVSYSLATNALTSNLSQTFVSVGGNVEVVVTANAAGTFNLDVGNVPGSARGGAVVLERRRQPGVFVHRRLARGDDQLPVEPERLGRPGWRASDRAGRCGRRDEPGRCPGRRVLPASGPGTDNWAHRQSVGGT